MDKKVVLIGIDGADPRFLEQLIADGKLPNFAKLKESGTFKQLQASMPPHSPVAWTTIATGTNPGKHNIFDFIARDPKTYIPSLALSVPKTTHLGGTYYESIVTANPFWRTSTKADVPTSVLRWPVTFPPEEIKGHLLSGLGVPDVRGLLSGYTFYTTEEVGKSKGPENLVQVENIDGKINTVIYGPRKIQGNAMVDVTSPMKISISGDKITIALRNSSYDLKQGEWSDWMRVSFKIGLLKEVTGIAKAHLASIEPFRMYLTAVQIDPEKPIYSISYPARYSAELAQQIGLYYTLGIAEDTGALNDKRIDEQTFLEQTRQIEIEREKMFWYEFAGFKAEEQGVFAFVFDSIDRIQHMFWKEDAIAGTKPEMVQPMIDYFVKKDEFLGKVLNEIDEKTSIIIVSDHGFTSFQRAVSINRWLVDNGFMTLTKEPEDDGGLFQNVDWSKTTAYSLGFNSLYINLEGREANGIVKEKDKVMKELIEKLSNLKDGDRKAINKLYLSEEIYNGKQVADGPDIMIGYNPGYRSSWQTAIGGLTKETIFDNDKHWQADHLVDPIFVPGVLFTNFNVEKEKPEQRDIAPTILKLLGANIPEEMDGSSLIQ